MLAWEISRIMHTQTTAPSMQMSVPTTRRIAAKTTHLANQRQIKSTLKVTIPLSCTLDIALTHSCRCQERISRASSRIEYQKPTFITLQSWGRCIKFRRLWSGSVFAWHFQSTRWKWTQAQTFGCCLEKFACGGTLIICPWSVNQPY